MRALDCDCRQHLEAANDEELLDKARDHVNRDHPNMQLTDEQVRQLVMERVYDKKKDAPSSSQPSDTLAGIDIPSRASAIMGGGGMEPSSARPTPKVEQEDKPQEEGQGKEEKGLIEKVKDKLTDRQQET